MSVFVRLFELQNNFMGIHSLTLKWTLGIFHLSCSSALTISLIYLES